MRSYAGCNNVGLDEDECVCVFPNKDQTSVQTVPINPAKSDGKKGNICPSPVSDINTADDDPDMWCKLLLYNSIKQVLRQLAQRPQWGLYYHRTLPDSDWDRESGSGGGQTRRQRAAFVLRGNCMWEAWAACWCQSSCVNVAEKRGRVCIHGYL